MFTEKEYVEQDMESSTIEAEGSVEGNIFVMKGAATTKGSVGVENACGKNLKRTITSKVAAINMLQSGEIPLVVDDFHYIDKKIQKSIVRALKAPIMHGLPVIFIAIPNRKYDARNIAIQGFDALNVKVSSHLIAKLSQSAYGSPFLM